MKRFLFLILIVSFNISASDEGIQQWVYNTLERAQANLDKGNIEAAAAVVQLVDLSRRRLAVVEQAACRNAQSLAEKRRFGV